ncbi:copper homeostasis periplasmic binding protein CopC [Acerihabitans sp. TG2]|uniref:copper homeostasis periplasmic binding protein CopC n=1 Tax=Acerihabitans sp. TG2 TaxID=3096008 RepID=UPI003A598C6F
MNAAKRLVATLVMMAGLVITQQAQAHAHLEHALPADKSVVQTSPKHLTLSFSEGVEAAFSGIVLKDAAGKTIATGKPAVDAADNKQLLIALSAPLTTGKYQVNWHAVSVDGHKTHGNYMFTVK